MAQRPPYRSLVKMKEFSENDWPAKCWLLLSYIPPKSVKKRAAKPWDFVLHQVKRAVLNYG